jgi:hypothetical protein
VLAQVDPSGNVALEEPPEQEHTPPEQESWRLDPEQVAIRTGVQACIQTGVQARIASRVGTRAMSRALLKLEWQRVVIF